MEKLKKYLEKLASGPISNTKELEGLLSGCWDKFKCGEDGGGMQAYKLNGRMEKAFWDPPVLTFTIERHGGTAMGSSRAELQDWEVYLHKQRISFGESGFRQKTPRQPPLDTDGLAMEITDVIINQKTDDRIKWLDDGQVRVQIGKIIPAGSAVKHTLEGRRKRFRKRLTQLLAEDGWQEIRANLYGSNKNK